MRAGDAVRCAFADLRSHKMRSGLTMLGIMFGVGAVIAMLSIGAGAEKQSLELIETLGVRNIVIRAKQFDQEELAELRKRSAGLSLRDLDALREAVPKLEIAVPRSSITPYYLRSQHGESEAIVLGVSRHQAELTNLELEVGRFIDEVDEVSHAQVCVLGPQARRDLFGMESVIGRRVKVNDLWLTVIGAVAPAKNKSDSDEVEGVELSTASNSIYIPFSTLQRKFDRDLLESPLDEVILRMKPEASPTQTAAVVNDLLDHLHGGVQDVDIVVPEALLRQSRETQRIFNIVMGCIAGISLLVGGIGIMNIMLASVLEQTREIGVRRAVGAKRRDVRFQFLVSSFSLSVLGGVIGIAVGLVIAEVVAAYAGWPTIVTLSSIVVSTGVSVAVGLLSGLYPAIRASRLQPIEALQHD